MPPTDNTQTQPVTLDPNTPVMTPMPADTTTVTPTPAMSGDATTVTPAPAMGSVTEMPAPEAGATTMTEMPVATGTPVVEEVK